MEKIRVGLHGMNGHQIHNRLKNHPDGEIAAVCMTEEAWKKLPGWEKIPRYDTLDAMLAGGGLDMVCLCSPRRADQERDAMLCLEAGCHVYAEKPAVLSEAGLDRVLAKAAECGKEFHEIADTVFYEPYWSMRRLIREGKIGEVVQVYAQKSYPMRPGQRPQEEETDGGLIRWVGIHAVRFVEHITGLQVTDIEARETHLGNGTLNGVHEGGLFTAAVLSMTLENGGVASICMNYLNPTGFPGWGNEHVRVFGTGGVLEITDGGAHSHIYTDKDEGEIDTAASDCVDFLDLLLRHLRYGDPMPMDTEEELHPLRVVIRAKEKAVEVRQK
ncbi:MAG: Gfo/Idh/MocA family oxidoreductase [Ruminococcaceae bacterium]|nr:Gfo/Idh/MocA family oxidoreductase [Oscillospiraceae bacterium]